MNKIEGDVLKNIEHDVLACKDLLNDLCNHADDLPDLKIGYELGSFHMILMRILDDINSIKSN